MKKALILGCGPSGLLAAHAAQLANYEPIVVSIKRPSPLFGCQYLHQPIPTLRGHDDGRFVEYLLRGTAEQYADKVYGPERHPSMRVSVEDLLGVHQAWDIRKAYEDLWYRYQDVVTDECVTPHDIEPMRDFYRPDVFVSTIPAVLVCKDPTHDFRSTMCWAVGDAPERRRVPKWSIAPSFAVVCDGTEDVGYYRASNVFGYCTVEWPGWRSKPPVNEAVEFRKPLSTTCDCWPFMRRLGRMGKWQKGVLAHESFFDMQKILEENE